jgi:hypothetical protein
MKGYDDTIQAIINNVAVKTQADCGISGLPDKKETH